MKIKRGGLKYSLSFLHSWLPYNKEAKRPGKNLCKWFMNQNIKNDG